MPAADRVRRDALRDPSGAPRDPRRVPRRTATAIADRLADLQRNVASQRRLVDDRVCDADAHEKRVPDAHHALADHRRRVLGVGRHEPRHVADDARRSVTTGAEAMRTSERVSTTLASAVRCPKGNTC